MQFSTYVPMSKDTDARQKLLIGWTFGKNNLYIVKLKTSSTYLPMPGQGFTYKINALTCITFADAEISIQMNTTECVTYVHYPSTNHVTSI